MYTEEERAKFRQRFTAWKNGKKPYDGGRIAEVVITPDQEYNQFLNTLPDNQRLTPEENYTTHRYWELNDKPKNFSQGIQKGMYTMEPDGWHANTVSKNKKTGEIEFMKPWNHPSIGYEYDWYRSSDPEAVEFRKQYKHVPSAPNAKYVPKYRNGKTPHEEFVEQMGPVLYKELLRTNTPNIDTAYDHMLRQLAYESDYGRSRVARQQHNYGGYGWNGKTYTTFKDDEDFVRHYVQLMNNRYGAAVNADSVQAYGKALKDKGYYEDTLANYTRNLVGMRSLSRSAAAHRQSNPNLYQIKPLALTPATEQLESAPQFQPVNIVVPEVNTDYSLQNASMQSPAPQAINAWKGKGSPAYGGYSLRMPSIEEYMMTKNIMPRGFKDGKLPGYEEGTKPVNVGEYKVYPSAIGASELNVTTPDVVITGTDRRPMYQRYYAENSTYDPDAIRNFTDWAPVVSDIGQGLDAYNAFKNQDYLQAGVLGGLLLLPNVIEKPLKAVGKVIKPALSDLVEYTYKGFDLRAPDNVVKKWKQLAAATELSGGDSSLWGNIIQKGKKYIEYPSVVNQVLKNSIYPRMKEMRPWIKDSEFDRMFNTTADNKWTMHPVETFKAAYGDKSNVIGLYTPDTGNIAVKAGGGGEDISDILLHEIRHKLDDGIPLTEEETKILKEAYGDKFLEIPKVSDDWVDTGIGEDYNMWPEAVTTNRDARSALLGPIERYMNVHQQNLVIDKMSDQQIVEAVANANGYGRRFVDNLIGDGPLDASLISKEQIEAWREAMKKIGMFSGAAYLTSKFMPEYKDGKSPIHIKPANRGKLTRLKARTGKSESELYNDGNPAHKKMVVFARNARKWKH